MTPGENVMEEGVLPDEEVPAVWRRLLGKERLQ
jgi:hypothetical protein